MRSVTITSALAAVLCVFAAMAASAFATTPEFVASEYPVEVEATSNNNGFEISGAVVVCKKGTFKSASILKAATTLAVTPTYGKKECKTEVSGHTYEAEVTTTGCEYNFFAPATTGSDEGTVEVKCSGSNEIKVTIPKLSEKCVVEVGPQSKLPGVVYENGETESKKKIVKVKAKVTGISYTSKECPGIATSGSAGKYEEGEITSGEEVKLLGAAARANVKGYKSGTTHEEANELGVEVTNI
jgi:serine protease inhibitor ecotin